MLLRKYWKNKFVIRLKSFVLNIFYLPVCHIIPDKPYLRMMYWLRTRTKLDLNDPKTFTEKLQWLKLYDRKPEYIQMVDKYEVKTYVAKRIGREHIIPTLGVWENFDEIDFSQLPEQFVLKCTHDSGGIVICRDKANLDLQAAKRKINKSLKRNFYYIGREWPYKNVKPRIIAEQYMVDKLETGHDAGLKDYKFFCYSGRPVYIVVDVDRYIEHKRNFYDLNWKNLHVISDCPAINTEIKKPDKLNEMLDIAKKLSNGFNFVRVDLYNVNEKIYFGELTFYPWSGYVQFSSDSYDFQPVDWNRKLGDMIHLNECPGSADKV